MNYPYRLPFSRVQMYLTVVFSLAFVVASLWFLTGPGLHGSLRWLFVLIGLAGLSVFGLTLAYGIRMLASDKLALEINDEGIRDETTIFGVGLVRWEDITDIRRDTIMGSPFICIDVEDPDKYYERARGTIARSGMRANRRSTGAPININCSAVKVSPEKLLELLRDEWTFQRQLGEGPGLSLRELIRRREELLR